MLQLMSAQRLLVLVDVVGGSAVVVAEAVAVAGDAVDIVAAVDADDAGDG